MNDHYIFINESLEIVGTTTVPKDYTVPVAANQTAVKVYNIKDFKLGAKYIDNVMVVEEPVELPLFVQAPYKASRAAAYPSVKDQLDMLWKSMDDGTLPKAEPFYSVIAGVKNRFPKQVPLSNSETIVL